MNVALGSRSAARSIKSAGAEMRPIIVLVLAALLFLGFFVIGEYRQDQEFLRQHLEQRDARNREFNRRMDEVEERREGGNL
jgi:hypothetical protein